MNIEELRQHFPHKVFYDLNGIIYVVTLTALFRVVSVSIKSPIEKNLSTVIEYLGNQDTITGELNINGKYYKRCIS